MTDTSKPPPAATNLVAVDGLNNVRKPKRFGSPTTIRVTFRSRAYSVKAADAEGPSSVTVWAPKGLREPQNVNASIARLFTQVQHVGSFDRHHEPFGIQRIGESLADTHQLLGLVIRRDGDQEAVARQPGLRCRS